ncbi:MAG: pullulanase-type alpha-1,6-glucosidase [Thermoanaerobaculaceae bacterium]
MRCSQSRSGAGVFAVAALAAVATLAGAATPPPATVTIAGSLQSELGCAADWQPECTATQLSFDPNDTVWQQSFMLPAGSWEYKAALNGSWNENYGLGGVPGGGNIPLTLDAEATVKFYYDHGTHWITSNRNSVIATAPGSYQKALGCSADWDPGCLRSWLQDPDGDGTFTFVARTLPAGSYEVKVAIGESWDENYGAGGERNGPNIPFSVPTDCTPIRFSYDPATHVLTVGPDTTADPQPQSVTIAGGLQSELGCSADWQPECTATRLELDTVDGVWQKTLTIPAGSWEYKAALNGSWDENYGANATRNGANIALTLAEETPVKLYYDHATHWITSNRNTVIATAPGSFQKHLGCPNDWDPGCLRSWLEDPDGDGVYTFTTASLPAGTFELKVAVNESWDENYGAGGVPNGPNITFTVPAPCTEMTFSFDGASKLLTVTAGGGPRGNLRQSQAHWVDRSTIAWRLSGVATDAAFALHSSADAALTLELDGVKGGESVPLSFDPTGLPESVKAAFPHLASYACLRIAAEHAEAVRELLRGQLAVSATSAGKVLDATGVQIPGVLDDLFPYDGSLGVTFEPLPVFRLWAPTAHSVSLHVFPGSTAAASTVVPMTQDTATGVWSAVGQQGWKGMFYLYEVEVYAPSTGKVERNLVSDPYSTSLSANSQRSQVVDLSDPTLKPAGWDFLQKPPLRAIEDIVLYELHVRDFSATDKTVPEDLRGTFRAFALASAGTQHLKELALAGVTHVHLLPAFDFATVNEDRGTWKSPTGELWFFPPDSESQQVLVGLVRDEDGFNWGYDPWHYSVPEGSYSTDPDGSTRILEFRAMVKALSRLGLRVVMDVVYNHTTASGQSARSVLDRIVPGYYHRLDGDGNVERSSCCENTASEHAMMEKLVVDSVLVWARQYKVDGFRFDLMGHHMKANMEKVRDALGALTLKADGVDGSRIYVYGEAWNFGEVANNARGVNAIQANMAGIGIGSFNDRMRDGARGGGPFGPLQGQGFISGLYVDPNATDQGTPEEQKARLLHQTDWIHVGLAGTLASYTFENAAGQEVAGADIDYNGQQAGYTAAPREAINYVSAHDNETLFDAVQLKAPATAALRDRVRMHNLGISLVALAQGIPFFHAGDELLRSKSLDRNSYNSGDWFNAIDWTGTTSNFGVGLPPAGDNGSNWPIMKPLLADLLLKPGPRELAAAQAHFLEMVAIRRSSELFRLPTAADVAARLQLFNTGPEQLPGLVVMGLVGSQEGCSSLHGGIGKRPGIVVVFNAAPEARTFTDRALRGLDLVLHPLQQRSADRVVQRAVYQSSSGSFSVPGRTTAVFVCSEMAN